ncbi:MAG: gamma-glutamyl-gamma-aminobutyrate hydrolase family protein [Eubacteriaceae bacterium]
MSNKKPLIGILPLYDSKQKSYWMYPGYLQGVIAGGGIPVVLSVLDNPNDIKIIASQFDGFLLTGGQDIDPKYYGEQPLTTCNEIYPPRDFMEKMLVLEVIKMNKPILGVCRGLQLLNVVLGGTLYQDIEAQMERKINLLHGQTTNFDNPIHEVIIKKESRLYKIMKTEKTRVNSMHHQGIAKLSPRVLSSAVSEDGLVEAIEIPEIDFGIAVQWHPEFLWEKDPKELSLFKEFVGEAKNKMK